MLSLLLTGCLSVEAIWRPTVLPEPALLAEPLPIDGCVFEADVALLGLSEAHLGEPAFEGQVWDLLEGPFTLGDAVYEGDATLDLELTLGPPSPRGEGLLGGDASAAQVEELGERAAWTSGTLSCDADTLALAWADPPGSWACGAVTLQQGEFTVSAVLLPVLERLGSPDALFAADLDGDGILSPDEWTPEPIAPQLDGVACDPL